MKLDRRQILLGSAGAAAGLVLPGNAAWAQTPASIGTFPDGVTADWHYVNDAISSNSVVLNLTVDDQTVYTSEALLPGQSVDGITLTAPLAPGTYQGMAVTTIYDAQGEMQLTNRVPVTIHVAG